MDDSIFTPTEADIDHARSILAAYESRCMDGRTATPGTSAVRRSDLRAVARTLGMRERDPCRIVARLARLDGAQRDALEDGWRKTAPERGALLRRRRCHLKRLLDVMAE